MSIYIYTRVRSFEKRRPSETSGGAAGASRSLPQSRKAENEKIRPIYIYIYIGDKKSFHIISHGIYI